MTVSTGQIYSIGVFSLPGKHVKLPHRHPGPRHPENSLPFRPTFQQEQTNKQIEQEEKNIFCNNFKYVPSACFLLIS